MTKYIIGLDRADKDGLKNLLDDHVRFIGSDLLEGEMTVYGLKSASEALGVIAKIEGIIIDAEVKARWK